MYETSVFMYITTLAGELIIVCDSRNMIRIIITIAK